MRVTPAARLSFLALAIIVAPVLSQTDPASTASTSPDTAVQPINGSERVNWVAESTVGPASLLGGTISAGWGTLFNTPHEYGPHWEGFGDRYGMRLTGIATSNTMEAALGAIWGEDPRYVRAAGERFGGRVGHVVKMAFVARNREGHLMPAFARYAGITGSSYISNTWRVDSDATISRATIRVGLGFLGRIAGNAWDEFWPDAKEKLFHRSDRASLTQP